MGKALWPRAAALLLCTLWLRPALAQDADPKAAAKAHFDVGNGLLAKGEVAAALTEFQHSRALFPTRGNTLNAAIALQRLGRFDEALELYSTLPRDFELDREQRQRVDRELELLRALTGQLRIRVDPGARLSIDGRDRGVAPFEQPLVVLGGTHTVRAYKPGYVAFERRIEIVTAAEQPLVIELTPAPEATPTAPAVAAPLPPAPVATVAPPPPAPPERPRTTTHPLVLGLDAGPGLGLGFGGALSDSCGSSCKSSAPLGFSGRARGGYRLAAAAELGLELGYLRLRGNYRGRADTLEPVGSGPQPGSARDDLDWSSWSLGVYAGWSGASRVHAKASLGIGFSFARLSDDRRGHYQVDPPVGDPYEAQVGASKSGHSGALYLAPEVGLGFSVDRSGVVVENADHDKELAYFRGDYLTGGAFFTLVPRLGASARF
ncbi:MAG TPA: PEGA domain-containing protein [Polyangiaceae bacterium]|nr:PEGA domain-containing protein [Polyangiaceae bacterium]